MDVSALLARTARARLTLLAATAGLLAGCVYPPMMQSSYQFDRHPGVFMETWWQYGADGVGYRVTNLVNRSGFDKCAWTDTMDSHLLRVGETWMISQVQAPGNVGVANVVPSDPTCANAKRDFGGGQR